MFFWLLKYIAISFSIIYLAHKLFIYLKNRFTNEKVIDLVDIPETKYKNILNTLQENNSIEQQQQQQQTTQQQPQQQPQLQPQQQPQLQPQLQPQKQNNTLHNVKDSIQKELDTSVFQNMENELQDFLKEIETPEDKIKIFNK